jgi:hypothetical protein
VILEATAQAKVGNGGTIRVELTRQGLPTLSDERKFAIVAKPATRPSDSKLTLPRFEVVPVNPDDRRWLEMGWPEDINLAASSSEMESGKLTIYYSTAFPRFADARCSLEARDTAKASSFVERYKIWLAVHSFFIYRDQQAASASELLESSDQAALDAERREREERCRTAALSVLFATREVAQMGMSPTDDGE